MQAFTRKGRIPYAIRYRFKLPAFRSTSESVSIRQIGINKNTFGVFIIIILFTEHFVNDGFFRFCPADLCSFAWQIFALYGTKKIISSESLCKKVPLSTGLSYPHAKRYYLIGIITVN